MVGAAGGIEAVDLLRSRNARPQKAFVGRAQWKIDQSPIPEEITSELGGRSCIARFRYDHHLCHVLEGAGKVKKKLRNEADLAVQHPTLLAQTG